MSTPVEELLGMPINPADNLITSFENIWKRQGSNIFAPNGINGAPNGALDPVSSINYLMNKRSIIEKSAYQRPRVRLADKNLRIVGELTGEMSIDFEELMADSGTAKYVVDWDNWMVDYMVNLVSVEEDLHLVIDPIPTMPHWSRRWGGKIHTINVNRKDDGTSEVEIQAISNREHAKRLLFASNPFFPPEVQLPQMFILPGPTRSILFMSCFINLARLFVPGLSFITNVFNPFGWLSNENISGTNDSLFNVDPLSWPVQVAFVNPILDESRWTVLGATWTTWHDATVDILKDAGVMMRAYTWLEEDIDSPYDELIDLVDEAFDLFVGEKSTLAQTLAAGTEKVVRPTRNCVIFRFEDKSGQTGPTGTALDGLLNVIGVTLDDLVSSVMINAETGLTLDGEPVVDLEGNNFPIFESALGVAPAAPKLVWREGQFMAQLNSTHSLHKGAPKTVMTGGKSPSIVNALQTFGIKYGLSQLQDMINAGLGTFVNTAFQMPATPGLDELYQGQLDNVLFAWERITSPLAALWGGDLDFQEYFERGSSTAYTLSGIVALQTALWKTRAYQSFTGSVLNGYPWSIDVDTTLGDRNGWEFGGIIFVDQIYGIRRAVTRKSPLTTTLKIGDDKDKGDPMARVIRAVQAGYMLFSAFLGQGTFFN